MCSNTQSLQFQSAQIQGLGNGYSIYMRITAMQLGSNDFNFVIKAIVSGSKLCSKVWFFLRDPLGEIGTHLLYIATGHLKIHHKVLHNSSVSMVSLGSDACRIERLPGDGTNKCAMSATTVYPLGGTVIGFTPAIPCSLTNLS